jgi:ATP-dependent helicase/nuclease subunit A
MTGSYRGILASAGTGKTYALTTELLGRFLAGEDPSSVFAATFTRTAAGEILDRILRRLCWAAQGGRGLDDLRTALNRPDLLVEDARAAAGKLGRSLDRVSIWTLDAFLVRVATAFSVEIGLPPGWRITGDDEDAQIRRAAIGRVLREGGKDVILPLLRMLKKSEGDRSVRESISRAVNAVYGLHVQASAGAWEHVKVPPGLLEAQELARAAMEMQAAPLAMTKAGKPHGHWVTARTKFVAAIEQEDWLSVAGNGFASCALSGGTYYSLEYPEGLREPLSRLAMHARAFILRELVQQNSAASELASRFESAYGDLKRERGAIRFDDLPRLIMAEDLATVREELYYRLDARIRHVLLDEFQDTSVAQFRVLEPMLAEVVSDETQERTLFYVGDPKQSLFGWRDAEPALISKLGEWWEQIEVEKLARSYRSAPEVLKAVNLVFTDLRSLDLMRAEGSDRAALEWDRLFTEHTWAEKLDNTPGRVVVREFPDLTPRDATSGIDPVLWCRHLVERVIEIQRSAPDASIGILLRRKTFMPRLLSMLGDAGIDAAEEGGSPLTQSPAVAAVLSLLHMTEHPDDTLSAFHAASTALGELVGLSRSVTPDAVESVATAIRERLTRDGLASFVESCANWLRPAVGDMDRTRLSQLVECAVSYDRRGGIGVAGFAELVHATKRPAGVLAQVRVMTIHAAKGLEFDAVIVPELDQKIPAMTPEVLYGRSALKGPVTAISLYANACYQEASAELNELAVDRQARENREALCLLYVAMTRARRYLELIVKQRKMTKSAKSDEPESFTLGKLVRARLTHEKSEGPLLAAYGQEQWALGLSEEKAHLHAGPRAAEPREVVVGLAPASIIAKKTASDLSHHTEDGVPLFSAAAMEARTGGDAIVDRAVETAAHPLEDSRARDDRRRIARGLGTAVHACLEQFEWLDGASAIPSDEDLRGVLARTDLPFGVDTEDAIRRVRQILSRDRVRRLLTSGSYVQHPADTVELKRELAGLLREPESGQMRARIDRMVIVRRGGEIVSVEIADWKTDGISAAKAVDADTERARAEGYMAQMGAYRSLAARALGVEPGIIRCILVMVATGRIIEA